ncbi:MAG: transcription termination/antitermination protein NusG [Alphaproteobacteria bacterium]
MAMRWYVLHVYSGFEKKVAESIKEQAEKKGWGNWVGEVLVPTETVVDVQKGKKVESERKFFPGYVLIQMEMNDDTWHMIKQTPKTTGFLGGKKPVAMTQKEAEHVMQQMQEGFERPRSRVVYETGEQVRVIDGPFASFTGVIDEVDTEKTRMKVSVTIFGRPTSVDLDFAQVEKV